MLTKDTPIIVALRCHPSARDVFARHGMACVGCMASATETLESAARAHGIDVHAMLRELNALGAVPGKGPGQ